MKKKYVISIIFILGFTSVYGQSSLYKRFSYVGEPSSAGFRVVGNLKSAMAPTGGGYTNYSTGTRTITYARTVKGWRYGVVNANGRLVIGLRFNSVYVIGTEATVKKNNKTKIINLKEIKDPLEKVYSKYDYVGDLWKGLAVVKTGDKYGFIDGKGKEVIAPTYDWLSSKAETYIAAKKGDKWGFITRDNKVAVEFNYEQTALVILESYIVNNEFLLQKHDGKWGYTDPTGQFKSNFEYDTIVVNGGGIFPSPVKKNNLWGLVDFRSEQGERLPPTYDSIGFLKDTRHQHLAMVKKDGKYSYINNRGKLMAPLSKKGDIVFCPEGGAFLAKSNGKFGFVIRYPENEILFDLDSATCDNTRDGYFVIRNGVRGRYDNGQLHPLSKTDAYYITEDFNLKEQYDKMEKYRFYPGNLNYALVHKNGKMGSIDRAGNQIVSATYDDVGGSFLNMKYNRDNLYEDFTTIPPNAGIFTSVKIKGKWGVVNEKNQFLVQPVYDKIKLYSVHTYRDAVTFSVFAIITKDGLQGLVDMQGDILIKPIYEKVYDGVGNYPFAGVDAAAVKKDGKWGYINKKGQTILPFQYEYANHFEIRTYGKEKILARVKLKGKSFYINLKGKRVK